MKKKLVYWCACWALIFIVVPLSATATELPVGVAYRGHIQDRGDYPLDGSWVDSPEIIGTTGQSKRIEGFLIKLTGEMADVMELRYNVHVQNRGWLYDENDPTDWPRDGAYAGTRGESLRIEAVKIVLTDSAGKPVPGYSVEYRGHVQNVGDQPQAADCWLADGAQLGTVGSSLRLEALLVRVVKNNADLTAYNALVAKIAKLNEDDFTAQSWAQLQTAVNEHAVTADQTQAEVDAAVAMIQAAYESLTKKNEPMVYDKAGTVGPASGTQTINGDVTVDADGVILQNLVITGDLLISEAVGNGTVTLNNVTVDGDTLVRGGGVNSIHINGGQYSRIVMEKTASGAVRIVAKDVDGLDVVIAEDATGETIILEGAFDSVEVNAPNMTVTTQGNTTTIGKMTVGEAGAGSTVTVNPGTTVSDLVLDGKAAIRGQGTVVKAEVNADGAVFDKKPGSYTVEPKVVILPVFPTLDNGGGSGGGYTPPGPVAVTGVSLDKTAIALAVNGGDTLTATVAPAAASNKALSWSSSDETIATVNSSGGVTALSEGQATITVTTQDGHKSATCVVTVKDLQQTIAGITVPFAGESPVTAITATSQFSGTVSWQKKDGSNLTPLAVGEKFVGTSSYLATINLTMKASYSAADIPANFFAVAGATATNDAGSLVITAEFLPSHQYKITELGVITAYSGPGGNVTIPETINGIAVTGIGESAFYNQAAITAITLPATVTAIGNNAFLSCTGMSAVTFAMPAELTSIGDSAFYNCQCLTAIEIPAQVKTISTNAFGCDSDKVPDSRCYTFRGDVPTTLGAGALPITEPIPMIRYYANYSGYDSWILYARDRILATPTQLPVQIGNAYSPFVTVSWNAVAGTTDYEVFYSNTSGSFPMTAAVTTADTTATITGLDSTKNYYFVIKARDAYGESLPSNEQTADMSIAVIDPKNIDENGVITTYTGPGGAVVIPEKVGGKTITGIGANAFTGKVNVTAVSIPQTVTSIGAGAFANCSNLGALTFAGSSQLTAIGYCAFQGCRALSTVTLPDTVKTLEEGAFMQCTGLTSLDLGSVETIGNSGFYCCVALVNLTIPNTVTSIANQAFRACTSLKTVHFIGGSNPQNLVANTFMDCTALETVTFDDTSEATFSGYAIFAGCGKLNSVTLPPGLTKIPGYTFESCTALTSLTIPATVTTIEVDAFKSCPANLLLRFDGNAPGSVVSSAFPTGTTFAYWEGKTGFTGDPWENSAYHLVLRNASLSQTDETINTASFSFDAQTGATAVELQQKIHSSDTWITAATTEALTSTSTTATATGLTPGTAYDFRLLVTGGDNAGPSIVVNLNTLVAVTGITLNKPILELSANGSETLTAIVEPADAANRNLNWTTSNAAVATVNTDTGAVTAVGAGAATITATAADGGGASDTCTVTVLPYETTGTDKLTITKYRGSETTVSIPETIGGNPVVAIGYRTFYNNQTLTEVTIPASVTSIGTEAFNKCYKLTQVTIPASVTSLGEGAFHNCNNLTTVSFASGSQLISIAKDSFSECPLTSLTLPSQLQTIGDYGFYNNCLTGSLTIPPTVTSIGTNAFEGKMDGTTHLSNLDTLTIQSAGALSIGSSAFKNQPLTTITLPTGVSIGSDATTMGTNGTGFLTAYQLNGAGTYQFTTSWTKMP